VHEREQFCFQENSTAAHIEYKKGNWEGKFFLYQSPTRSSIVLQGRQILLVPIINKIIIEKRLLRSTFA
jgi:hypothetical protein